jgi:hypothetical protein
VWLGEIFFPTIESPSKADTFLHKHHKSVFEKFVGVKKEQKKLPKV